MPAATSRMDMPLHDNEGFAADKRRRLDTSKSELAYYLEQRAELDSIIASLRASIRELESSVPSEEQTNEYEGLSVTDAAIFFIRRTGRPQTEDALVRELQRGGWKAKSPGTEEGNIRRGLGAENSKGLVQISENPPTYDVKKR